MSKRIIITGATKGIGLACVERLAQAGHDLMYCTRNQADLDLLTAKLKKKYPNQQFHGMSVDVSQEAQVGAFVEAIRVTFTTVDVLINNAGVFMPGSMLEQDEANLEFQMQTNFWSAYRLCKALLPAMVQRQSGQVINMCSVASLQAFPAGANYSISKFALYGMSKALREELKPYGIRVNAILPGATWSNSWAGIEMPEDRLMQADAVAQAVQLCIDMEPNAVVEDIVLRPQLGDL